MENEVIPEFGIKRENEERRDGGCGVIFDPETRLYAVGERAKDGGLLLFGGGVDADEDMEQGVLREIREESGLHDFLHIERVGKVLTHYHNIAKGVDRVAHATCFLLVLRSADILPTQLEEHEKFALAWVPAEKVVSYWQEHNQNEDYSHWIYFLEKAAARLAELGYAATSRIAA